MSVDITKAAEEGNPEAKHGRLGPSCDGLSNWNDGKEGDWKESKGPMGEGDVANSPEGHPDEKDYLEEASREQTACVEARDSVLGGCALLERKQDDLDVEEVARMCKFAAEAGDVCGWIAYGDMLLDGFGVDENPEEAARYYKLAADKGNSFGMWRYGKCLQKGLGVDRDVKEAARYYKASADLDNKTGMLLYGKCLRKGEGVEKDEQAGTIYFLRGRTCSAVDPLGFIMLPVEQGPLYFRTQSK